VGAVIPTPPPPACGGGGGPRRGGGRSAWGGGDISVVVHGVRTSRSNFQYQFTPKHHGADKKAAQWLPSLTLDEEFAVFNTADQNNLADAQGDLYGAEKVGADDLRVLGTRGEQVAKFPATPQNQAWHGYPAWALAGGNRAGEVMKPAKAVLERMEAEGIITKRGRKRLGKGDPV
jgi:hypothetical protein